MKLLERAHLGYSTNIHRGDNWAETFASLDTHTLAVRKKVCPGDSPFGIGLRLSHVAAEELSDPRRIAAFRQWLDQNNCYVFTINGFPYGSFHGTRVKENVYKPDWQTQERLEYTQQLFRILVQLLPTGASGSVSTLPGSFKPFISGDRPVERMCANLVACAQTIEDLSREHGVDLHLGLEPEPFGYFETTEETIAFFDTLRNFAPDRTVIERRIGVNYDTCHMAIQFEDATESLAALADNEIRISKIHLSSALAVRPSIEVLRRLQEFVDPVYLHQVVSRRADGQLMRWQDLDLALDAEACLIDPNDEWRIHFHIPLYTKPEKFLGTTSEHLKDTIAYCQNHPSLCQHFEFETYTWEVLPEHMRAASVVDQLVNEYDWCLKAFESDCEQVPT
ncbi:MAG: metabolite traffic protein EboE [Verrucomicrobiota bacterium]